MGQSPRWARPQPDLHQHPHFSINSPLGLQDIGSAFPHDGHRPAASIVGRKDTTMYVRTGRGSARKRPQREMSELERALGQIRSARPWRPLV